MIDKGRFLFKPNRYKDYYVNFEYQGKSMLGILGYASELELCIVHKGMQVAKTTEEIKGYIKKRGETEKYEFHGRTTQIENETHKGRDYILIWLYFDPPINLSETLIALEIASFSEV